jgi:hypothetical protein
MGEVAAAAAEIYLSACTGAGRQDMLGWAGEGMGGKATKGRRKAGSRDGNSRLGALAERSGEARDRHVCPVGQLPVWGDARGSIPECVDVISKPPRQHSRMVLCARPKDRGRRPLSPRWRGGGWHLIRSLGGAFRRRNVLHQEMSPTHFRPHAYGMQS